jgi:N-acetylmuramoyl-L-alanine amidase
MACLAPGLAGAAQLLKGTLNASEASATLTLQLSGAVQQRLEILRKPDRIVLDLPATRAAGGWHRPAPEGVVRAVRAADLPRGTLRVVLELERPLDVPMSAASARSRCG